ncbi:hypothetical protein ABID29_001512 [Streptococcus rupicaprae]|uniref:Uncharacterized protein n=1 Tax=Streptococcus rupicaprae TaxID=759619 RepID=A0ABV2FIJ1_9STRE
MPVTYHKQDEWDKLFEKFAKFDELEAITFPDPEASELSPSDTEDV